eukprot:XP_011673324.1 PREDICTED: uncharacterized protein LOC576301 [Strongylocentrotus purpuratus]
MKIEVFTMLTIYSSLAFMVLISLSHALSKDEVPADPVFDKYEEMVALPGGKFMMGSSKSDGKDGESVQRKVTVKPFKINKYPITAASFRKFVRAKKYKTDAEKYAWSFAFDAFVPEAIKNTIEQRLPGAPWWIPVQNAYWRQGPGSGSAGGNLAPPPTPSGDNIIASNPFEDDPSGATATARGLNLLTRRLGRTAAMNNQFGPYGNSFHHQHGIPPGGGPYPNNMANSHNSNGPMPPMIDFDLFHSSRKFVRAKKYKTDAEKYSWSFAFDAFVPEAIKNTIEQRLPGAPWWIPVQNAYWRQPEGKGSGIENRLNYPAVHISNVDARAFCQWHGWRLPTEPEWEFAARGSLEGKEYPWGKKFEKNRMNIWQGKFPEKNTKADGYHGVSPVDAFPPQNDYDLYDMIGNVWEWTSTKFSATPSAKDDAPSPAGEEENPSQVRFVLRGGSYIDSKDGKFNHATRVTTRMGNEADAGSDNLGFRCAVSLPTGTSEKKPKGKKKNADNVAKEEPTVTELPEGAKFVRPNPADLNGKGKKKKNRNEL